MYVTKDGYETVVVSPEGQFLLPAGEAGLIVLHDNQVVEVCDVCEELGTLDDALGQFGLPGLPDATTVAHYQCGVDEGLTLS